MAHFDLLDEIFNIFLSQNNFLCKNGRFFIIIFIASIFASIYSMLPGKFSVFFDVFGLFSVNFRRKNVNLAISKICRSLNRPLSRLEISDRCRFEIEFEFSTANFFDRKFFYAEI